MLYRRVFTLALAALAGLLFPAALAAQTGGAVTEVVFTPRAAPVLLPGPAGAWDSGFVMPGDVIYVDGRFHLFYTGGTSLEREAWAVGYATSEDGVIWTRYVGNPIIQRCRRPFECGVSVGAVLHDGGWVLYLNPHPLPGIMPARSILRATSAAPTGPWMIESQPVLEGTSGSWDHYIAATDAVRQDDTILLYYTGWDTYLRPSIGLAISPDGLTFEKYDDPEVELRPFMRYDPVLDVGPPGSWDGGTVQKASVWAGPAGWDMVYFGLPCAHVEEAGVLPGIGYASSADGIHWTRIGDAPIVALSALDAPWWPTLVVVDETYYLYYGIPAARDTSLSIGLATGTVTRE